MILRGCKDSAWLKPWWLAVVLFTLFQFMGRPVYADETPAPKTSPQVTGAAAAGARPRTPAMKKRKPDAQKITFTSDRTIINRNKHTIKLLGNVRVHQADTLILSDELTLFLKQGAKLGSPGGGSENAIKRIVADGHVTFKLDMGTAYSDHAEYTPKTRLLVLTGTAPKFISRENTITGSRITVNRDTGMITFDGGKGRVQAVIYSKDRL